MKKHYDTYDQIKDFEKLIERPEDFDEFWNKQVEKLKGVDLKIKLEKVENNKYKNMDLYYLSFSSFDGNRIYCKYIKAISNENTPLILQFHGYPGASRSFFELSSYAEKGISVLAMDCRGQGGMTNDRSSYLGPSVSGHLIQGLNGDMKDHIYVKIFLDTILTYQVANNLEGIDKNRIFASGSSQGAALSIVCSSMNKDIKKVALMYPFLSDFKRVYQLDYDEIAYEGLRYYSRWFDPDGSNIDKIFEKLSYIDVSNFARNIKADVIYGISLADEVCPPIAQASVYKEIKSNKKLFSFPGYGHEKICDMEENLIPFFLDDYSINNDYKEHINFKYSDIIINKLTANNNKCILYLNPSIEMKSFYFRRFLNLGYDIFSPVSQSLNEEDISFLINSLNKDYDDLVIIGYREYANIAIKVSSIHPISGLIIQGIVEDYNLLNYSKKINCPVLLATLGLDNMSSLDFNFQMAYIQSLQHVR